MYKVRNISKYYGENLIIDNISLNIRTNQINSIIGRSGCGKTTMLNIIAGIDKDFVGDIDDFKDKKISFVFQEDRLVNHLDVFENLKLVLDYKENHREKIIQALKKCDMENYIHYLPKNLSGGMRQRVNIVRAFLTNPDIILLDEPFKSIDIKLKDDIKNTILNLQKDISTTCILVEHNIDIIMDISDNINVLSYNPAKLSLFIENVHQKDKKLIKSQISKYIINEKEDEILKKSIN